MNVNDLNGNDSTTFMLAGSRLCTLVFLSFRNQIFSVFWFIWELVGWRDFWDACGLNEWEKYWKRWASPLEMLETTIYPFPFIHSHQFIITSLCKGGLAITTAACSVSQALYRLIALVGDKHLSMRVMVCAIWCGMATGRQTSAPTLYLDRAGLNMEPVGCGSPRWTLSWRSWTLFVSVKWENGTGAKLNEQTQWRVV